MKSKWTTGGIEILLLLIIFGISFFLVGGFGKVLKSPTKNTSAPSSLMCCDTGNGADCRPQDGPDQKFSWKGTNPNPEDYGLLKTGVTFAEGNYHLLDTGEKFNGNPIVINTTDTYGVGECGAGHDDQIYGGPTGCFAFPNDEIIYVCTKDCETDNALQWCNKNPGPGVVNCFGNPKSQFDVYFRMKDMPDPGVPDPIKNCQQSPLSTNPGAGGGLQAIVVPTTSPNQDLQLQTFKVVDVSQSSPWVSPYCKPAVYLYPTTKEQVSVKVQPAGHFTYTNPLYPENGWQVTADPNGNIISGSKIYSYLYYEADIPSLLIEKPKQGFIAEGNNVEQSLNSILSKLGLHEKEKSEMITYWQKALPKSPYYFIGVIPQGTLDSIAPLDIHPKPNTVIRVGLYFQPIEQNIPVEEPILTAPKRDGFTVVEWGGMVKTAKQFTCLQ